MNAQPPEQDWFDKADDDLEAARRLLGPPKPLPWVACYHAQQCAEKYLKGYLVAQSIEFNRVHDLFYLMQECAQVQPTFLELEDTTEILAKYGTGLRYPMDDFVAPDADEAREAVSLAAKVAAFVRQSLHV